MGKKNSLRIKEGRLKVTYGDPFSSYYVAIIFIFLVSTIGPRLRWVHFFFFFS